jgi:SAM-dependent methyltransferase
LIGMSRDWHEHYALGETPWDIGEPAPHLVELREAGRLPTGRALDVGCGTGSSTRYLAGQGYDAVGVDVVELAIDKARAAAVAVAGQVEFRVLDFLEDDPPSGPFDLVFDRGCFHVFDDAGDRARFAERVARCLAPDGLWVSLIGSTEGPPRDHGPPRRSARDVLDAVEPALEIVELRGVAFHSDESGVRGWMLMAKPRRVPAQPSTGTPET